jgi:hypothetical protein
MPLYSARFERGITTAIIDKQPEKMPEAPAPATARPIINIFELIATPQRRDPSMKIPMKAKNIRLREKRV